MHYAYKFTLHKLIYLLISINLTFKTILFNPTFKTRTRAVQHKCLPHLTCINPTLKNDSEIKKILSISL